MKSSVSRTILFASFALAFSIFLTTCDTSPYSEVGVPETYESFLAETELEAARLAITNERFELGRFIEGRWQGNCHPDGDSIQELEFKRGRAEFTVYYSGLPGGSAFEHGLYEVVSDTHIQLLRLSVDAFEIRKLGDNRFTVLADGSTNIYYGCTFTRQ